MRIEPQSEIVLARGLENHLDSGTYYVQAVIRNAKTDAHIATVYLTDKGERRFTKEWRVPQDPTGEGFDILVTYTVYTDSGYTTKSENYAEKFDEYRIEHIARNLGGAGPDIDYKRIRTMLEEVVAEKLKALPPPAPVEMPNMPFHLQPLMNAVSGLRNDMQSIELPENDYSGIEYRLNSLEKAIKAIDIPTTDLEPVLSAIAALQEAIEPYTKQTKADSEALLKRMRDFFSQDIEIIKKQVAELSTNFASIPYFVVEQKRKEPTPAQPQPIDYSLLLNE